MVDFAPKSTLIDWEGPPHLRFLLIDAPSDRNLPQYILEMERHNVTHLVRVCGATYSTQPLEEANIHLLDWPYSDGSPPPEKILADWLALVRDTFLANPPPTDRYPCIAVHCIAGLGRAPMLVAIGLMEFAKIPAVQAITYIRSRRRGAFNDKQLKWLQKYKTKGGKLTNPKAGNSKKAATSSGAEFDDISRQHSGSGSDDAKGSKTCSCLIM
eukprot:NODE_1547_length_1378_cov_9.825433_g1285_i0.p1 GENE.NODE_1547_length_1378_cov_9.825433_g1285_i0~~NODE_1547_length_1378_cov_9.825433_g1285_i0.p1  ORF type:complete len:213 (-),score=28.22 NODE_1547_length_1378_cov_9.825433_g1285_i0:38-676(-)